MGLEERIISSHKRVDILIKSVLRLILKFLKMRNKIISKTLRSNHKKMNKADKRYITNRCSKEFNNYKKLLAN